MLSPYLTALLPVDTTHLSVKEKALSIIAGAIAMFAVAWVTHLLNQSLGNAYPIVVSSIGASAALLFIVPHSPMAQPWPLIGGQLISAFVGMACAIHIHDPVIASGVSVAASFFAMLMFRCLHPPGASTALAPIMGGAPLIATAYDFVWIPVGINVVVIFVMAWLLNRYLLKIRYPHRQHINEHSALQIHEQDVTKALDKLHTLVDISENDIALLVMYTQQERLNRLYEHIRCASIKSRRFVTVKANMPIVKAWKLMQSKQVKFLLITNAQKNLLGIVTAKDFFIYQPKPWWQRINSHLKKEESVRYLSDIMTQNVVSLREDSNLRTLMSTLGNHRQIPIVDDKNRLMGFINHAMLIHALQTMQQAEFESIL